MNNNTLINKNATAMVNQCTMEEIKNIPLPEKTATYEPVSHQSVIEYATTEIPKMLPQFKLLETLIIRSLH